MGSPDAKLGDEEAGGGGGGGAVDDNIDTITLGKRTQDPKAGFPPFPFPYLTAADNPCLKTHDHLHMFLSFLQSLVLMNAPPLESQIQCNIEEVIDCQEKRETQGTTIGKGRET